MAIPDPVGAILNLFQASKAIEAEINKPGEPTQVAAPPQTVAISEEGRDDERKRKTRAFAGTLLTSRGARSEKAPTLKPLIRAGVGLDQSRDTLG